MKKIKFNIKKLKIINYDSKIIKNYFIIFNFLK